MSTTHQYDTASVKTTPRQPLASPTDREPSTETTVRKTEENDILPGRIFWLPTEKELPEQVVRPAYGKGPIDDGIYSHPLVITSRTVDGGHSAHFQLVSLQYFSDYATTDFMQITSLQGKTLDLSRRS
ncbi:hypothetical protein J1614_004223 [Plenodomus biglobosus]|nr:hypothetical protein J1614_004223 [Plenodomus biglobosus]